MVAQNSKYKLSYFTGIWDRLDRYNGVGMLPPVEFTRRLDRLREI